MMGEGMKRDKETAEDVGRDVVALLRAAVDDDWEQQTVVLSGAEHSGTLRGVTECLLGIAGESLIRCLVAIICTLDPEAHLEGTPVHEALYGPLGPVLDRPGVRDVLRREVSKMQAQVVSGEFGPPAA
jgi:hypothetical protein